MKEHTYHQHFVSKFYLKNFSYDGKHAYVIDRNQGNKIYSCAIEKICFENDLYEEKWINANEKLGKYVLDNQIEDMFARVETRTAPVIQKYIKGINSESKRISITHDEKVFLTEFTTLLYLRNPYIMKDILNSYDGVEDEPEMKALTQETEHIFSLFQWGSSESLVSFSKKVGIFSEEIDTSPYNIERESLINSSIGFWYSELGGFTTASFPLYIIAIKGGNRRVILPISCQLAVVFYEKTDVPIMEGTVLQLSREIVDEGMKRCFELTPKEMARMFIGSDKDTLEQLIKG